VVSSSPSAAAAPARHAEHAPGATGLSDRDRRALHLIYELLYASELFTDRAD
jgi:hypothetical protein